MGRSRWTTESLDAHTRQWRESGLTSEEYVAFWAPELPARTLRHHRQQMQEGLEAEVVKLRSDNAALKARLTECACRPATVAALPTPPVADSEV